MFSFNFNFKNVVIYIHMKNGFEFIVKFEFRKSLT